MLFEITEKMAIWSVTQYSDQRTWSATGSASPIDDGLRSALYTQIEGAGCLPGALALKAPDGRSDPKTCRRPAGAVCQVQTCEQELLRERVAVWQLLERLWPPSSQTVTPREQQRPSVFHSHHIPCSDRVGSDRRQRPRVDQPRLREER
jgi:hypothetical protein